MLACPTHLRRDNLILLAHKSLSTFRQRLFTRVSAVSLFLCLACLAPWARSNRSLDSLEYRSDGVIKFGLCSRRRAIGVIPGDYPVSGTSAEFLQVHEILNPHIVADVCGNAAYNS